MRKAAEQGDAEAQLNLGNAYSKGAGVAKDLTKAAKWYRKAAEQGNYDAMLALVKAYRKGEGVPKDDRLADYWLKQSFRATS